MSTDSVLARSTRSAVFLDRDGVINENRSDYVQSIEELDIFPTALYAIARLEQSKYATVIITNQSAIGRGLVTAATVDQINHSLIKRIRSAGGQIDGQAEDPQKNSGSVAADQDDFDDDIPF